MYKYIFISEFLTIRIRLAIPMIFKSIDFKIMRKLSEEKKYTSARTIFFADLNWKEYNESIDNSAASKVVSLYTAR